MFSRSHRSHIVVAWTHEVVVWEGRRKKGPWEEMPIGLGSGRLGWCSSTTASPIHTPLVSGKVVGSGGNRDRTECSLGALDWVWGTRNTSRFTFTGACLLSRGIQSTSRSQQETRIIVNWPIWEQAFKTQLSLHETLWYNHVQPGNFFCSKFRRWAVKSHKF